MLVFLALAACAFAEPKAEAEADPFYYGGYGHGLGYYGGYGHVVYGKRDAEAEAKPSYWQVGNGYPSYVYEDYDYETPYGYVTEAEAEAGLGYYGGYGKRDAEAEAKPSYWQVGNGYPSYVYEAEAEPYYYETPYGYLTEAELESGQYW